MDKLRWWEKVPLALLMAAQALVVFRWYAGEGLPDAVHAAMPWITTLFAIAAAVALDLVVVTTTMGRREGRESIYGMLTAASAAAFSALVALDVYGVFPFGAWLHAAYPVVTFVYAQHLAVHANDVGATVGEIGATVGATVADHAPQDGDYPPQDGDHAPQGVGGGERQQLPPRDEPEHVCPHCGAQLASPGQKGAAIRYGYCHNCKPAPNGNGNGDFHNVAEMEVVA